MKYPIEWHRANLANSLASEKRLEEELARKERDLREQIYRLKQENGLRSAQIAEAVRRGMTAFDSDRLLVKRQKTR